MWQRRVEQDRASSNSQNRRTVVSSSSKSSSSSSSSTTSPAFTSTVPRTPSRTMEEVWKDITLSTTTPILDHGNHRPYYHHHPAAGANCHSSIAHTDLSHLRGMILQDFLGRPFKGPPTPPVQPAEECGHHGDAGMPGTRLAQMPRRSLPATVLSLNPGGDLQYMDPASPGSPPGRFPRARNHSPGQHHGTTTGQRQRFPSSSITAAAYSDSLGSPCPGIFSFCGNKKRAPEQPQLELSDGPGADRRHKRMIKNRESAARSRARKQAYTNELELEVNHLTEENERLRRQHEELRAKMAAQLSTKKALQRSSTAPF